MRFLRAAFSKTVFSRVNFFKSLFPHILSTQFFTVQKGLLNKEHCAPVPRFILRYLLFVSWSSDFQSFTNIRKRLNCPTVQFTTKRLYFRLAAPSILITTRFMTNLENQLCAEEHCGLRTIVTIDVKQMHNNIFPHRHMPPILTIRFRLYGLYGRRRLAWLCMFAVRHEWLPLSK